jgi:predicted metal-dependent hydrolase
LTIRSEVKSKIIEIQGVKILLERSWRAKNLSVTIRPFKGARVAIPCGITFQQAGEFAKSKALWIKKHAEGIKQFEQEAVELKKCKKIDRNEAQKVLVERLEALSIRYGIQYNKVFIRKQKTLWGSCSWKNNINLNINLVRLPDELMDYTILHELVHTRIKDHSKHFWDELEKIVSNAKENDKQLNRYVGLLL